ncbi:hypothetical protein AB3S75_019532 [Citrus x aurantiifolia]
MVKGMSSEEGGSIPGNWDSNNKEWFGGVRRELLICVRAPHPWSASLALASYKTLFFPILSRREILFRKVRLVQASPKQVLVYTIYSSQELTSDYNLHETVLVMESLLALWVFPLVALAGPPLSDFDLPFPLLLLSGFLDD